MSTSLTTIFETEYSGSGVNQTVDGFKRIQTEVNNTRDKTIAFSTDYEALGRRMERPLGRLAFAGIAEGLLSSEEGMVGASRATVALEGGLHAVGNALLFVQPEFGLLAIGLAAVVSLFVKLSGAAKENAEHIAKQVQEQDQAAQKYKESADVLQKAGLIDKQQEKILQDLTKASKEQVDTLKNRLETQKALAEQSISDNQALIDEGVSGAKGAAARLDLVKANERLVEITKALTGLTDHYAQSQRDAADQSKGFSKATEDEYNTLSNLMSIKMELAKAGASGDQLRQVQQEIDSINALGYTYQNAETAIIKNQTAVAEMEQQLTTVTDAAKRDQLQAVINWFNQTIAAEKAVVDQHKQTVQALKSGTADLGQALVSESGKFMGDLVKGNMAALKQDVSNFAWAQGEKLFAMAVADVFDPLRAGLAPEEFAASAGLFALGASLGGGSGSTPGGSGGGASAASPTLGGSSNTGNTATLTVNIMGAQVIDPSTTALILKGLNSLVEQNGYPLTATKINGPVPSPGG